MNNNEDVKDKKKENEIERKLSKSEKNPSLVINKQISCPEYRVFFLLDNIGCFLN
jgi:hypothetical protein